MKPKDPLIIVHLAEIVLTLPDITNDLNLGKELLLKGLKMAPNDLTVLKAVARVIILSQNNVTKF